jgi:hypothetical protein
VTPGTARAAAVMTLRKTSAFFSFRSSFAFGVAIWLSAFASLVVATPAAAQSSTRYERRSEEMFLPDPLLDPFGGDPYDAPASMFLPRVPDSVEHEMLEEEQLEEAEREEWERQMVESGQLGDPNDDLALDRWDGAVAPPEQADEDGFDDPAAW